MNNSVRTTAMTIRIEADLLNALKKVCNDKGATALGFADGCNFDVQVGNPTHDTSLEKASVIHRELIVGGLPYANAFEHCATPIDIETTSEGITHFDVNDIPYSGNFANWAQI